MNAYLRVITPISMDREETRTHRKRVPKKFGTRFYFNILQEPEPGKSGLTCKVWGAMQKV